MAGRSATLRVDVVASARRAVAELRKFGGEAAEVGHKVADALDLGGIDNVTKRTSQAAAAVGALALGMGAAGAAAAAMAAVAVLAIGGIGIAAAAQSREVQAAFSGIGDGLRSTVTEASAAYIPLLTTFAADLKAVLDGPVAASLTANIAAALPVVQAVMGQIVPLVAALVPVFDQVFAAGLQVAEVVGPALSSAVATLIPVIGPLIAAFAELGGPVLATLIAGLAPLLATLAEGLIPVFEDAVPVVVPLIDAFLQILGAALPLVPALLQVVVALTPIITIAAQLVATLVGALVPSLVQLADWITRQLAPLQRLQGDGRSTQQVLSQISQFITGTLVPAFQAVYAFVMANVVPMLGSILRGAIEGAMDAFRRVQAAVEDNRESFQKLQPAIQQIGPILRVIGEVVGGVLNGAFRVLGFIISAQIGYWAGLIDVVTDAVSVLRGAASLAKSVGSAIGGAFGLAGPPLLQMDGSGRTLSLAGGIPPGDVLYRLAGATGGPSQRGPVVQQVLNIRVEGAVDPIATAQAISTVQRQAAQRAGRSQPLILAR